MKGEDRVLLAQLSKSLEEAVEKIEKAYIEKNAEEFNKLKKFFFQIQEKIREISK